MSVDVVWDDAEKTILRQDFRGKWTWEEYFAVSARTQEMMSGVSHTVDIIADMKPGTIPMSGSALTYARNAIRAMPPNRGNIMVVVNPFVAGMLRVFKNFDHELGQQTFPVDSVENARKMIIEKRPKSEVG